MYTTINKIQSHTYVGLHGSGLFNFGSYVTFPTLFTRFLGFNIPTSSFILFQMFSIILVSIVFFFLNGVNIFCKLQKYWCKLIKICSSMKVNLLYLWIDYLSLSRTNDVYSLFHLQHCLQSYKK